ncbi:hypothetical protein [Oligosphaera ethanolica]|uniref:Uncharacterized protein n=1 Tax=Oligosphaera ethanolica TaxID=760260 RepID=A0AAE4ANQ3_9BACT|nr:hypothetical protein [Oligosphaera ethanolica]MDQ0288597.1 hypothetical protein [Oligosphaera ethanolica]
MQETHGQPPPSHPTLISADLCGSVFHRSDHPGGENTGDNLQETHGQPPPSNYTWVANLAADFMRAMLFTEHAAIACDELIGNHAQDHSPRF